MPDETLSADEFNAKHGKHGKRGKKAAPRPKKPSTMTTRRKGGKVVARTASCPSSCEEGWRLFSEYVAAQRALRDHIATCQRR